MFMMLTKLERNELYHAIVSEAGCEPAEFWVRVRDGMVVISHDSGSRLEIVVSEGRDDRPFYEVRGRIVDGHDHFLAELAFDRVRNEVLEWAHELKHTLEAPDYWAEIQRSRELIADIHQTDLRNTPFTQSEREQVVAQLQEIKKRLHVQFELTTEQVERIEDSLNEVAEASKRMGRKDWRIYFLGTVTALTITATLPSGIGEHIFTMFVQDLMQLFTGGSTPPRIIG